MKIVFAFLAITLLSASVISDDSDGEEESTHASYYYVCLNFGCRTLRSMGYGVIYGCIGFTASTVVFGCALVPYFLYGTENTPRISCSPLGYTGLRCSSGNFNFDINPDTSEHIINDGSVTFHELVVIAPIFEELLFRRILQPIINRICLRLLPHTDHRDTICSAGRISNLLSSIAFGLYHTEYLHPIYFVRAFNHGLIHYCIDGRCYQRHGLVAVITSHATNNAISFFMMLLLTQSQSST